MRSLARYVALSALLAAGLTGCDQVQPASPTPDPVPSASPVSYGSDGLTVRYLDDEGKIKTLDVEDFPR